MANDPAMMRHNFLKSHLNTAGLILVIIGTLLVWFFVGELYVFHDKAEYLKGHGSITLSDPTPDAINKFKRNVCASRIGIGLIVAGEILQIISNYV
jgi:hypothetical protein